LGQQREKKKGKKTPPHSAPAAAGKKREIPREGRKNKKRDRRWEENVRRTRKKKNPKSKKSRPKQRVREPPSRGKGSNSYPAAQIRKKPQKKKKIINTKRKGKKEKKVIPRKGCRRRSEGRQNELKAFLTRSDDRGWERGKKRGSGGVGAKGALQRQPPVFVVFRPKYTLSMLFKGGEQSGTVKKK